MANAERDDNRVTTLMGVSLTDLITPEKVAVDPANNRLLVSAITTNGLVAGEDFDYIDIQQTSATVETFVFKLGGSGGTTAQTIVVTYTSSAKTDLDTVVYS